MLKSLRTFVGSDVQVFPIYGMLGGITKGPLRHLVLDGQKHPLYDEKEPELDPAFSVGKN